MKHLVLLLTLISQPCLAAVCGLYQIEDFGDRVLYTLTDFRSEYPRQNVYTIQNPASDVVKIMVRGICYCVDGREQADPEYEGDRSFRVLFVDAMTGIPYQNCGPND